MTSGNFISYPVDQIFINRDKRQRRELTGIQELSWSINASGLINPITITRDGELIAGERRLTAVKSLGWTHISAQYLDDLDPAMRHLVELEENVRRIDLSWQDQCLAVEEYHNMRKALDPEWDNIKTATALGISPQNTGQRRDVAKEILRGNTTIAEAPKFSVARGIVARAKERKQTSIVENVIATVTDEPIPERTVPLIHADFNEWVQTYDGPKFNFIHCDFPYGVNADKHAQGAAAAFGGYSDSEDVYWRLVQSLAHGMGNVVAESAHLMFWFSMDFYQPTLEALTEMGWDVQRFPLIWHKSDNVGILPDHNRGPRRIYETCLMASRGDRPIVRAVSNVVSHPTTKQIHMSEKPVGMLTKFMEMFVDGNSSVLDPTAGSANALKAATARGAALVLGLEYSEEFFNRAKEYYFNDERELD